MKKNINDILFNGYVKEPLSIIVFPLIVGIALLALSIWSYVDFLFPPSANLMEKEVVFVECVLEGPIYNLSTSDNATYYMPRKSIADSMLIDKMINERTPVKVECLSLDSSNTIFDIHSLSTIDGSSIISSEAIIYANVENAQISIVIMWTICILYWTFILSSYFFVSNAPQYPRIASFLIREAYRNF